MRSQSHERPPCSNPRALRRGSPRSSSSHRLAAWLAAAPPLGGGLALAALTALGCGNTVTVIGEQGGAGGDQPTTHTTSTYTTPTTTTYTWTTSTTTYTTTPTTTTGSGGQGGFGGEPPIPALVEEDLGTVTLGEEVDLDVPPGTMGITAHAHTGWSDAEVYFDSLFAPSGAALVEDQLIAGTSYAFNWYGDVGMQVPQDDDAESMFAEGGIAPGLWRFVVGASGASQAHLSVWRRQTVDGLFHGGVVDFNVFITPGAATASYMESLIRNAFAGFVGLDVGSITFYPLGQQWAVIDEYNALPLFQQTSVATTRPAVNVMVVQSYEGMLAGAGGFSMGIPGIPLHHGTYQSGLSMLCMQDTWWDSIVITHEIGHLAGLFHTTEIEPGSGDPLEDTPSCPDVEGMGYDCPDGNNLMFPYGPSYTGELSARQIRVVRASAIYRGRVEEGGKAAYPLPAENGVDGAAADAQPVLDPPAPSAIIASGPRIPAHRAPRGAGAPWAAPLPRGAASYLGALWDPAWSGVDPFARLARLGGDDPALLMEVAERPDAPNHVRMRARMAAAHLHPSAAVVRQLAATAADRGANRFDRLGALYGLETAAPDQARQIARGLRADPEPAVATLARRLDR